ncbi:cystathionine beta-lyase [Pullulanibacillus pueri]|uniref:cysteine-S-conjugate beta-lyase n=1 Tax=Pullulanibacillus pueri TaxID=1437324 RepID=A0A8J2ZXV6_9BACL|nr:PatB family C-S lyase [Pullulanibacillus pueri]MBM7684010.1 cystathionine beta-lyase [Pullulanibacillus pueri]GGH85096.1 cystathionine beta-lyase [Pullulanibacillus pueri]
MVSRFDEIIERRQTGAVKWDSRKEVFGTEDVLPLWVADMDFACPPEVVDAIVKKAQHPVYGYPKQPVELFEAIQGWLKRRFDAEVPKEWLGTIPGVVPGIRMAVETFTKPGDKIVIQTPVYPPFYSSVEDLGRHLIKNPLKENDGYYTMDFEDLERKIDAKTKMLILCHPHNPIGRVWTKEELMQLAEICRKHGVIIVSDEIHSDLVYEKGAHTPFYTLPEELSQQSISFIAGSKTFNLAGLFSSIVISNNTKILDEFKSTSAKFGLNSINLFGLEAMIAAYTHGDTWLDELLEYLKGNADYISNFLKTRIPEIKMRVPEATYLGWLDFRALNLSGQALRDFVIKEARLGLNDGDSFGVEGQGFQRINFACPRSILEEAMERLEAAVKKLQS